MVEVQASPALQAVLVSSQGMGSGVAPASDLKRVAARWLGVARLWWRCPAERRRAWAFTAACVALSLTNVCLLLWISYVQNALQTALSEKQQGGCCGSKAAAARAAALRQQVPWAASVLQLSEEPLPFPCANLWATCRRLPCRGVGLCRHHHHRRAPVRADRLCRQLPGRGLAAVAHPAHDKVGYPCGRPCAPACSAAVTILCNCRLDRQTWRPPPPHGYRAYFANHAFFRLKMDPKASASVPRRQPCLAALT